MEGGVVEGGGATGVAGAGAAPGGLACSVVVGAFFRHELIAGNATATGSAKAVERRRLCIIVLSSVRIAGPPRNSLREARFERLQDVC